MISIYEPEKSEIANLKSPFQKPFGAGSVQSVSIQFAEFREYSVVIFKIGSSKRTQIAVWSSDFDASKRLKSLEFQRELFAKGGALYTNSESSSQELTMSAKAYWMQLCFDNLSVQWNFNLMNS